MIKKLRNSLNGFLTYQPLLRELVVRDIKVRYRKSFLGITWTVLNPLLMMLVMVTIFSHLFRPSISNYPVYILTGQLVFNFFSSATNMGLDSIVVNSSLIKKVYIPKYLFPISVTVSCLVNFGFSTISMILVLIITRAPFHLTLLCIPIPLFFLFLFILGVSMILSAVNVYFRDIGHLYGVIVTAWMYFTPIFWTKDILPEGGEKLLNLNPLYHYLSYFRSIIMDGVVPSLAVNLECLLIGIASLVIGMIVFAKLQDNFILHVWRRRSSGRKQSALRSLRRCFCLLLFSPTTSGWNCRTM